MYLEHFGLREVPFSLAPDPRYLYLSAQHREALAHLLYGVMTEGGFVQVTGEVGTGKTTVCRCFLERLPGGTEAAVILNPRLDAGELVASICDEFRVPGGGGATAGKAALDRLNAFLLEVHGRGGRAVLVIDEAQNLDPAALELVRLLTNLETSRHKLLQIVLMGQPELRETLARPELRQLAQRVTARFHLGPLTREETGAYLRHRLSVAGCHEALFPADAVRLMQRLSGGIPRLVNILADRALLGAYTLGLRQVSVAVLRQAAREVSGTAGGLRGQLRPAAAAAAIAALAALATVGGLWWAGRAPGPGAPPPLTEPAARPAPVPAPALEGVTQAVPGPSREEAARPGPGEATASGAASPAAVPAPTPAVPAARARPVPPVAAPDAAAPRKRPPELAAGPAVRRAPAEPAPASPPPAPAAGEAAEAPVPKPPPAPPPAPSAGGAGSAAPPVLSAIVPPGAAPRPPLEAAPAPVAPHSAPPAADTGAAAAIPAPERPVRPAAPPALAAILLVPEAREEAAAERRLFDILGAPWSAAGGDACEQARRDGLACLRGRGSWEDVLRHGRPGVVEVRDGDGAAWILLEGQQGGQVTLAAGGARTVVAAERLAGFPVEAYLLAWRPPAPAPAGPETGSVVHP